jgi:general secretion pathway protein M
MNTGLERYRAWWAGLAPREQRILGAGAIALGLILFFLLVWEPLTQQRAAREQALMDARALAEQLEITALEVRQTPAGTPAPASLGQSLLAVVDQSVKTSQIGKAPSRLQPEGDNTVRLWLDDVPFDAVVRWLHALQSRHGVNVENADIERQVEAGRVSVRVTLVRGG